MQQIKTNQLCLCSSSKRVKCALHLTHPSCNKPPVYSLTALMIEFRQGCHKPIIHILFY